MASSSRTSPSLVGLVSLLLLCLIPRNSFSHSWNTRYRIQFGLERDSNIFETTVQPIPDESIRMLLQGIAKRSGKSLLFSWEGSAGMQLYRSHSIENKSVLETQGYAQWNVHQTWKIALLAGGRLKKFFNDALGYAYGYMGVALTLPFLPHVPLLLGLERQIFDYQRWDYGDSRSLLIRMALQRSFGLHSRIGWETFWEKTRYKRGAWDWNGSEWVPLDYPQQDISNQMRFYVQYFRIFLLEASYFYETLRSNSYGFPYTRHQVTVIFTHRLGWGVLLRLYGAYQWKTYPQRLTPILQRAVDVERGQSNAFILDLSKNLSERFILILRAGYLENETLLRNLYYQKGFLNVALEMKMP